MITFSRSVLVYGVATIISKAIPFLMMPYLTSKLSDEDYGYLGLFSSIMAIGGVFVGLRPEIYFIRSSALASEEDIQSIRSALLFLVVASAAIFLPLIWLSTYFYIESESERAAFVIFFALIAVTQATKNIFDTECQFRGEAYTYFFSMLLGAAFHAFFAYIVIESLGSWWGHKVAAEFFAIFLVMLALVVNNRGREKSFFDVKKVRAYIEEAFKFLWPLTFHVVAFAIIGLSDRLIIAKFLGAGAVGQYTVAYTFGMILGVAHDSFLKAWNPYFYAAYANGRSSSLYVKQVWYCFTSILLLIVFCCCAKYVYHSMVDEQFHGSFYLVPIVALAFTFEGMRKVVAGYLYVHSKTMLITITTVVAALSNVGMNLLFVPTYGLTAAAISTVVSFFIMLLITLFYVVKYERS